MKVSRRRKNPLIRSESLMKPECKDDPERLSILYRAVESYLGALEYCIEVPVTIPDDSQLVLLAESGRFEIC